MKYTPWFPVKTKPARIGFYQMRWDFARAARMARWDGRQWWPVSKGAALCPFTYYLIGDEEWRGLFKKAFHV